MDNPFWISKQHQKNPSLPTAVKTRLVCKQQKSTVRKPALKFSENFLGGRGGKSCFNTCVPQVQNIKIQLLSWSEYYTTQIWIHPKTSRSPNFECHMIYLKLDISDIFHPVFRSWLEYLTQNLTSFWTVTAETSVVLDRSMVMVFKTCCNRTHFCHFLPD